MSHICHGKWGFLKITWPLRFNRMNRAQGPAASSWAGCRLEVLCSLAEVVMMQTAQQGEFDHVPTVRRLHRAWHGTIVIQGSMGAEVVIIFQVGFKGLCKAAVRGTR